MALIDDLNAQLLKLENARNQGAQSVSFGDRHVTYRSVSELTNAIAQIRADIAEAGGSQIVRSIKLTSTKDL